MILTGGKNRTRSYAMRGRRVSTCHGEYDKGWMIEESGFDSRQGQDVLISEASWLASTIIQYVPVAL